MESLLLLSKTRNLGFFKPHTRAAKLFLNWIKWPERESNYKPLSNVEIKSGAKFPCLTRMHGAFKWPQRFTPGTLVTGGLKWPVAHVR